MHTCEQFEHFLKHYIVLKLMASKGCTSSCGHAAFTDNVQK